MSLMIALANSEYSFWVSQEESDYRQCLGELAFLAPIVQEFLNTELVTPDNIGLLKRIESMCGAIADFTLLTDVVKGSHIHAIKEMQKRVRGLLLSKGEIFV